MARSFRLKSTHPEWIIEYHLHFLSEWIAPFEVEDIPRERWGELAERGWSRESRERVKKIYWLTAETVKDADEEVSGKTVELVRLLKDYAAYPMLLFANTEKGIKPYVHYQRSDWHFPEGSNFHFPDGEHQAVHSLMMLAQLSALPSLKICGECGKLFRPVRSNQNNCSGRDGKTSKCSKQAGEKTPKERARRRAYNKKYYDEWYRATSKTN